MAESLQLIDKSSDNLPDDYCEPCFELKDELNPVEGHCIDCCENLCQECFINHLGPKPLRNHKLVDRSAKPQMQPKSSTKSLKPDEICSVHGATLQSFCKNHSQLCCKVCHTINHKHCDVKEISKMARNIHNSQELQTLTKKLNTIKKGFEETLRKTSHHELTIQKNFTNAINDMNKLKNEIDKLLKETEKMAESVKEKDVNKIETVSSNCNIVIDQINNITSNLDKLKEKKKGECLFISMKQAESQLKSFEEGLVTLENDNTVSEYKFELDEKLKATMRDLKVFGQLIFFKQVKPEVSQTNAATNQERMADRTVSDINTKSAYKNNTEMDSSSILSYSQGLVTDDKSEKATDATFAASEGHAHPRVVELLKTEEGLGFNVMGGKAQNSPIYISRIIPGGVADRHQGLKRGDQLISVNGVSVEGEQLEKAVELLKLAQGKVRLVARYSPRVLEEMEARFDKTHPAISSSQWL